MQCLFLILFISVTLHVTQLSSYQHSKMFLDHMKKGMNEERASDICGDGEENVKLTPWFCWEYLHSHDI